MEVQHHPLRVDIQNMAACISHVHISFTEWNTHFRHALVLSVQSASTGKLVSLSLSEQKTPCRDMTPKMYPVHQTQDVTTAVRQAGLNIIYLLTAVFPFTCFGQRPINCTWTLPYRFDPDGVFKNCVFILNHFQWFSQKTSVVQVHSLHSLFCR